LQFETFASCNLTAPHLVLIGLLLGEIFEKTKANVVILEEKKMILRTLHPPPPPPFPHQPFPKLCPLQLVKNDIRIGVILLKGQLRDMVFWLKGRW
jgi:hypothetical protein